MPDWGTWLLVAVAGWVILSTLVGMVVGGLCQRLTLEAQADKAAHRWRTTAPLDISTCGRLPLTTGE
jgi:hypothetical protein